MRGLVQDVTIPALGMAMTGAVLTRCYKEPGETVAAGEAIAEIETDKSAVDPESPADGVLGPHLVAEGDEVPIAQAPAGPAGGRGGDGTPGSGTTSRRGMGEDAEAAAGALFRADAAVTGRPTATFAR